MGRSRCLLFISIGLSLSLGLRLDLRLTALLVLVALLAVIAVMAGSTTLQRGELFGNPFREAASAGRTGGGVGVGAV